MKQIMLWGPKMGSFRWFDWNVHKWNKSFKSSWMTFQTAGSSLNWIIFILEMLTLKHRTAGIRREEDWCWYWWSAIHFNNDNWSNHDSMTIALAPEGTVGWEIKYSVKMKLPWVNLGLSRHCREDNRILETMIVATIVAIVATIKKIAKLVILKAKFKEINHMIWKIQITIIHFRILMLEIPLICALKTFL